MIKMIFCDVDGTLVQDDDEGNYTVSPANQKAVARCLESGVHFALATGRPADFIPRTFGRQLSWDTIAYTGAYVQLQNQVLYQSDFSNEEALGLWKRICRLPVELLCITPRNDYVFAERNPEYIDEFLSPDAVPDHRVIQPWTLAEYNQRLSADSFVSLVVLSHDAAALEKAAAIGKALGYDPVMTRRDGYSLMRKGVNKASGIKLAADFYHVPLYEIAALGDSKNDLEMFTLIEESYAMAVCHPEIEAKAKYKVKTVAEAIDQILKQNKLEQEMSKC